MCFDWTMQTYQIFQRIFSYLCTGLFYTIEVYPVSSKRASKQTPRKKEKQPSLFFFFCPKKELIHFRNIHGGQRNKSPDLVSSGNNYLVMH